MTIESVVKGENPSTNVDNRMVPVIPKTAEIHRPLGYVFSHDRKLNEMTIRFFGIGKGATDQTKNDRSPENISNTRLKIGILDRKASSGRSIVNIKDLVQSIQSEIARVESRKNEMNGNSTLTLFTKVSPTVSLEYFEGKGTLEEQIRFFNPVDILISPHGAQLTGIPFMANKDCTQLIEFFPNRYYMPDFYG